MNHRARLLLILAATAVLPASAPADIFELRDGRVVDGQLIGATRNYLAVEVDGKLERLRTADVLTITFEGRDESAGGAAAQGRKVVPRMIIVGAGTPIAARLREDVDSIRNAAGDTFTAELGKDLVANGVVVAAAGSALTGRIVRARKASRLKGPGMLALELTGITVQGEHQSIRTVAHEINGSAADETTATAGRRKTAAQASTPGAGTLESLLSMGGQAGIAEGSVVEFRLSLPFSATAPAAR